jgi:hypothetical protein
VRSNLLAIAMTVTALFGPSATPPIAMAGESHAQIAYCLNNPWHGKNDPRCLNATQGLTTALMDRLQRCYSSDPDGQDCGEAFAIAQQMASRGLDQ